MAFRSSAARLANSSILSAQVGAPVFSADLAEARNRARLFYREVCREVPWLMKTYFLEEVTTIPKLRSQLADVFRKNKSNDKNVVDVLLFKGNQEMMVRCFCRDAAVKPSRSIDPSLCPSFFFSSPAVFFCADGVGESFSTSPYHLQVCGARVKRRA